MSLNGENTQHQNNGLSVLILLSAYYHIDVQILYFQFSHNSLMWKYFYWYDWWIIDVIDAWVRYVTTQMLVNVLSTKKIHSEPKNYAKQKNS